MGLIFAFVAGYIVGGRSGNEGFDEVVTAVKAIGESQEVADLLMALRLHASHVLKDLGRRLEVDNDDVMSLDTVLDRVRDYVQRDTKETAF
jgi:hypothetical protein